jgi:hypothetical protein
VDNQTQVESLLTVAPPDGDRRDESRWPTIFGPKADAVLAQKLYDDDLLEYNRLRKIAEIQRGVRHCTA